MILVALIGFGVTVNASEGSCQIPGTNDYAQAYISGNTLTVVNGSSKPLASVHVVVYADVEYTDGNGRPTGEYERMKIFEEYFTSIPGRGNVKRTIHAKYKNASISVSNPVCK